MHKRCQEYRMVEAPTQKSGLSLESRAEGELNFLLRNYKGLIWRKMN
jgi:hypothetical protein